MIKNILITGSGGFIGQNLKEYLQCKYTLFCPRSFELDLLDEISVREYFKQNEIDFVIHCANQGGIRGVTDDETVIDNNLKMFHNLEAFLDGKRMIFFGSGAQYDKSRPLVKIKEDDLGKIVPKDPYGYSKLFVAKEIEKLEDVLCLNIFGSYGKHEKESRFPTYAILQNLKHEPIIINKNVVFDYLYIDDLCKIVEHFVENKPSEKIINVTPTQSISLFEIAEIVNCISDFKSEIIIKEQGLNNEYTGDNKKLLNEIKDFSFTSYEIGLKNLFDSLSAAQNMLR